MSEARPDVQPVVRPEGGSVQSEGQGERLFGHGEEGRHERMGVPSQAAGDRGASRELDVPDRLEDGGRGAPLDLPVPGRLEDLQAGSAIVPELAA